MARIKTRVQRIEQRMDLRPGECGWCRMASKLGIGLIHPIPYPIRVVRDGHLSSPPPSPPPPPRFPECGQAIEVVYVREALQAGEN